MSDYMLSAKFELIVTGVVTGLTQMLGSLAIFAVLAMLLYFIVPRLRVQGPFRNAVDYAFPRHLYALPSTKFDLCFTLLRTFLYGPAIGLFFAIFVGADLSGRIARNFDPPAYVVKAEWAILSIQFLTVIFAGEFAHYWFHRWTHQNRFLWTVHNVHHSAETMTFLTSGREHPLYDLLMTPFALIVTSPIIALSLYFTGIEPHPYLLAMLVPFGWFASVQDKFNHSHVPLSFGWLNFIFMSGHMHQIHHSAELRHRDKNFGGALSVFDWMFGTAYVPETDEIPRLGLTEEQIGENNPHKTVREGLIQPLIYLTRISRMNH